MEYFFDDQYNLNPADVRVEGIAKVTGKGKYAAEYKADKLCYAAFVTSTIPAGTIKTIHTDEAKSVAGVIDIITHTNKPVVPGMSDETKIRESRFGLPVFHTDKIYFKGQPIALVIAETLEDANYAASLVWADYTPDKFNTDFFGTQQQTALKSDGRERGTMDAWAQASAVVEAEYTIKTEVHSPMEMHATIAHWTADNKLRLYDKTQGVNGVQRTFARLFNIPNDQVEVISEFVGGGFGSGLRIWANTLAAVMAAKLVNRPVKLMLTRAQMFHLTGYRPQSWQRIKLGADNNGKFLGMLHQARHSSSVYENFGDGITRVARLIYQLDNLKTESAVVPLNLSTPTWMRGPGDCTGDFAIESAIDELCHQLGKDPVEIRMKNLALEKDPERGRPWSTNYINECIERGAATIGWKNRKQTPKQLSEGDWYIGYGMAVGAWNAGRSNASAGIRLQSNGTIIVETAMTDIGTGTGTGMQNIAHEYLGIPKNRIEVELGNSTLPPAPSQGGSTGLSSISGAVVEACSVLRKKVLELAGKLNTSYQNAQPADLLFANTGIQLKDNANSLISYSDLLQKNSLKEIDIEASSGPNADMQKYAFCSSAAHFCKVRVHSKTGKVKIERMVCVADGGRILNERAAANQLSGAAVGGIGMTLMEEQITDNKLGSTLSDDFAGYHFAVNADAPIIETSFINKPDLNLNPIGSKGLGEVGIIGCAAAIANAIFNASGKRLRDLPITPDHIL